MVQDDTRDQPGWTPRTRTSPSESGEGPASCSLTSEGVIPGAQQLCAQLCGADTGQSKAKAMQSDRLTETETERQRKWERDLGERLLTLMLGDSLNPLDF